VDERDGASESPNPGGKPGPQPKSSRSGDATNATPGVTGSGREGLPRCVPEDDFDADAKMARWVADVEAGRERIPEEWGLDGSAVSLSLGDARDLDSALVTAMLGPAFGAGPGGRRAPDVAVRPLYGRRGATGRAGAALQEAPG
jgi:hypothetical protein